MNKLTEKSKIEGLLVRYYDGTLTADEIAEVEAWIESSEDNRRAAEQIYTLCFAADALEAKQSVDTAAAFARVRRRIRTNRFIHVLHRFERVAAVMLLPLLALSGWLVAEMCGEFETMIEVRSTTGMVSSITLPDSTRVWLNSDSYLRYPSRFGKERRVTLSGEGYFSVAKDASRRFIVEAHSAEIEVCGTEFNVEAYSDDDIRTTLVSGRVNMHYDDRDHRRRMVKMMPAQQAVYNAHTGMLYLRDADVMCNISWKDDKIVLRHTSLEDALRMIGNKYNVEFRIRDNRLRGNTFTGTFSNQSLDVILRYFNISSNIRFELLEDDARDVGMSGRAVFDVF